MSKEVTELVVATIELSEGTIKEEQIQQEVSLVEEQAKELVITTNREYEKAAEIGKQIKAKAKIVIDFFKPMKNSAYQAHKAVCDREKIMLRPLQDAEKVLKKSMTIYLQEKEKKRKELEEKMRIEAEIEKECKLNEAVELEVKGKFDEAEMILMEAQMTEDITTTATIIMDTQKVKDVSSNKDWEIEEIDNEKVPIVFFGVEIRPVDEKAILRLIRASKGHIQIPGVEYKETIKMSIRG